MEASALRSPHPHGGARVLTAGPAPAEASAAVVMLHGRGGTAESMLDLADELRRPGVAWLAPQATGHSWYPYRFLEEPLRNEPWLSSALLLMGETLRQLGEQGVPESRVLLLGFSQGGCLALEYAARHPRRFGGVAGLSSGLMGREPGPYPATLSGTPVFLGCGLPDPHIPEERVRLSADLLGAAGAAVTMRLYPGIGHTVNADELEFLGGMLNTLTNAESAARQVA